MYKQRVEEEGLLARVPGKELGAGFLLALHAAVENGLRFSGITFGILLSTVQEGLDRNSSQPTHYALFRMRRVDTYLALGFGHCVPLVGNVFRCTFSGAKPRVISRLPPRLDIQQIA